MNPAAHDDLTDDLAAVIPFEQAVIGHVLLEGADKIPPLASWEFALRKHEVVWQAIQELVKRGEPVDALLVAHELRKLGLFEDAGGHEALGLLVERAAIAAHLNEYARRVRDAARVRMLKRLGADLRAKGFDETEIAERLKEVPGPLTPDVFDPVASWNEIVEGWSKKTIKTGLHALDAIALGLQPSDFLVIGARTSMGKTAMAVELALRMGGQGVRVDFFALEESRHQILRRMIANRTGILTRKIRDGHLSPSEVEACADAAQELQWLPVGVTDMKHLRSLDARRVVAAASASDARVVIVDHLQKIDTGTRESRVYGLERACNDLHAVALRDGKVMIVTAQLNREAEHRQGPPLKSDLRDSGGVEILARLIWLLYWPNAYDPDRDPGDYEIHVAKQGEAGTGVAKLRYAAGIGRFSDA